MPFPKNEPSVSPSSPSSTIPSAFNMSSISQRCKRTHDSCDDPDLMFFKQIFADFEQFDQKSKSFFKMQVQSLVHRIKYGV